MTKGLIASSSFSLLKNLALRVSTTGMLYLQTSDFRLQTPAWFWDAVRNLTLFSLPRTLAYKHERVSPWVVGVSIEMVIVDKWIRMLPYYMQYVHVNTRVVCGADMWHVAWSCSKRGACTLVFSIYTSSPQAGRQAGRRRSSPPQVRAV
jgi:hypothetical protein